ncbi:hypothetical protein CC80DRAFT_262802 [Byssothecium circinans]|uniref:Uncharacterized protein n=1 Tax=Byssothecium circinans TaxID=147558 RepID=A0A6A5U759_9PLEO|nr:hypothetical protein CC80DRAFT_262802 [Byssothecium circinans]
MYDVACTNPPKRCRKEPLPIDKNPGKACHSPTTLHFLRSNPAAPIHHQHLDSNQTSLDKNPQPLHPHLMRAACMHISTSHLDTCGRWACERVFPYLLLHATLYMCVLSSK